MRLVTLDYILEAVLIKVHNNLTSGELKSRSSGGCQNPWVVSVSRYSASAVIVNSNGRSLAGEQHQKEVFKKYSPSVLIFFQPLDKHLFQEVVR